MTDADLRQRADAMARLQLQWNDAAGRAVGDAMAKVHAHARLALTARLQKAPSGRPTLRHAVHSPSYQAACRDLDGLLRTLAGPSVASLAGLLRDAREALYRSAFAWWLGFLPADQTLPADTPPTREQIRRVRGLVQHGYDLRGEVMPKTDAASRTLLALLERASKPGILATDAGAMIDQWHLDTQTTLLSLVATVIGDAAVAVNSLAMVDAIRPEFRPNDGIAPE